jgi:hypothetical protein
LLVRCQYCQGKTRVSCPACDGSGTLGHPQGNSGPSSSNQVVAHENIAEVAPCGRCGATGEAVCEGCMGGGFVEMSTFA